MRLPISGAQFARDRALVLDGQIGNAAPRIEPVGRGKRRGRADVEAGAAGAAVSGSGCIGRQFERGEDRAEKQPRAVLARHQIGVLALPAEAGARGERLLHHRGGVDEHLHVAAGLRDQPARDRLQPRLDQLVIVVALGIDRDRARGRVALEDRQRIVVRPVVHAEHDDRAHVGPQRARVARAARRSSPSSPCRRARLRRGSAQAALWLPARRRAA